MPDQSVSLKKHHRSVKMSTNNNPVSIMDQFHRSTTRMCLKQHCPKAITKSRIVILVIRLLTIANNSI